MDLTFLNNAPLEDSVPAIGLALRVITHRLEELPTVPRVRAAVSKLAEQILEEVRNTYGATIETFGVARIIDVVGKLSDLALSLTAANTTEPSIGASLLAAMRGDSALSGTLHVKNRATGASGKQSAKKPLTGHKASKSKESGATKKSSRPKSVARNRKTVPKRTRRA